MNTNKTPYIGLHSWESDDAFKHEEFNENFAIIDAMFQRKFEELERRLSKIANKEEAKCD